MESDKMLKPPSLPWAVVPVLLAVTLGLFGFVWLIVLSNWVRKVRGNSESFWWAILTLCLFPGFVLLMIPIAVVGMISGIDTKPVEVFLIDVFRVMVIVAPWIAMMLLGGELREKPIALKAGRWKVAIFGITYLQFCLNRYCASRSKWTMASAPAEANILRG